MSVLNRFLPLRDTVAKHAESNKYNPPKWAKLQHVLKTIAPKKWTSIFEGFEYGTDTVPVNNMNLVKKKGVDSNIEPSVFYKKNFIVKQNN